MLPTLDVPSTVRHIGLMTFLHTRDRTIVITNNKVLSPFQTRLNQSWAFGLLGLNEIYAEHNPMRGSPATIMEIMEGQVRFAKAIRNSNGLAFRTPGGIDEEVQLVGLRRLLC
jgi:hypothetical protein